MAIVTGGNTEPNPNEDNKDINSKESMVGLRRESIAANTLEQAYITNNFLREILDTNREGVKIQQQIFNWQVKESNRLANKRAIATQEAGVEQQRGAKDLAKKDSKNFGTGGKGLGTGGFGWKNSLLALGLLGPALLRLGKGVESATGSFTGLTTRQGIMGFNQMMKGVTPFHQSSFNKINPKITGIKSIKTGLMGADPTDYSMLGPNIARRGSKFAARTASSTVKGAGEGIEFLGKGGLQNFFKGAFGKDLKETRGLLRQFNLESSSVRPTGQLAGMKFGNKIDDIFKSFKDLRKIPNSTWKGINDTFKAQKDLALNIRKVGVDKVKAFFNAPMQGIGKGLTRTGVGLKNLPGQAMQGWAGATKNLANFKQGPQAARITQVAKNTSTLARRIPVLGSLLSAGIGAMDANEEEMKRLREENPTLTDDQINARLKDGRLKKDKNKIIGRSAGAGIGAGTGTVLGGVLGSFAGPVGTAIGAALGAWIGENIGKFFGEGLFSVFKGFDWGETFRPVVETWNELTAGIGASFQSISEAFGVGEGKNGFIEGLKNLGKVLGIFAKVLLKTLIPLIQMTLKSIQWVVQALLKVVEGVVWLVSKIVDGIRRLLNLVGHIPGMGWLKDATEGSMGNFLDDVSGSIDNVNTGIPRMGDHDNDNNSVSSGTGESDRGFETGDPTGGDSKTGGGYGGDGIEPTIQKPYLTSGFKPSHRPTHQGIDVGFLGDRGGQPLFLPSKAKVTGNGFDPKGYGNWVTFTTQEDGITHLYGHMQKKSPLQMGKVFPGGTYAGAVGNTGGSDGAHLHWETGTIENQVGYPGGKGLRDPRDFGYGLTDPFKKAASNMQSSLTGGGSSLDGMSTNTSTSGSAISNNSSTKVDDATHQAQALSEALGTVNPAGGGGSGGGSGGGDDTSLTASGSVNLSTKPGWSDNSEVFTYSNN